MNQKQFKEKLNSKFPELKLTIRELGNNIEGISSDGKFLFQGSRYTENIKMFLNGQDCGIVEF